LIEHRYGLVLELQKANALLQDVVNGQKVTVYVHGQLTEVSREARQAVGSLETDVDNFLDRSVGKAKGAYQVLLTGGGALALSSRLLRRFPEATLMYEPVLPMLAVWRNWRRDRVFWINNTIPSQRKSGCFGNIFGVSDTISLG
jgi:hypothetical protein